MSCNPVTRMRWNDSTVACSIDVKNQICSCTVVQNICRNPLTVRISNLKKHKCLHSSSWVWSGYVLSVLPEPEETYWLAASSNTHIQRHAHTFRSTHKRHIKWIELEEIRNLIVLSLNLASKLIWVSGLLVAPLDRMAQKRQECRCSSTASCRGFPHRQRIQLWPFNRNQTSHIRLLTRGNS